VCCVDGGVRGFAQKLLLLLVVWDNFWLYFTAVQRSIPPRARIPEITASFLMRN
jgi:hypothetical protein